MPRYLKSSERPSNQGVHGWGPECAGCDREFPREWGFFAGLLNRHRYRRHMERLGWIEEETLWWCPQCVEDAKTPPATSDGTNLALLTGVSDGGSLSR